ncbi:MAG: DUF6502 family protein [Myxococcota bacterium]|nr:DUF6502 family protein [Myxococcota bacterium]
MSARPDPDASPGASPALRAALRRLLRPLVRLLLGQRVSHPELSALLRELYVEVADREFTIPGRSQTTTRVSLLTGVHRKEVKRLREDPPAPDAPPVRAPLGAQIIARWTSEKPWADARGRALPLPRLGDAPSFEALVAGLSTDMRPRTVLDEWIRTGVVELDEEDRVHLRSDAFVPREDFDEQVFFFGRNLRDHVAAGAFNLEGGEPPYPERAVYYGGLSEASAEKLRELAAERGMDVLRELNRKARGFQRRDEKRDEPKQRMSFGLYFYREPEADEDEGSGAR